MGKKVKCPGCSAVFTAGVGSSPASPKSKKAADDDYEVVDERPSRRPADDEDDEAVSEKPRPRRARDDDEDEDERPRRSRVRDDDDDEDDDERVTRRRKRVSRYDDEDDDYDDDDDDDDDEPRLRRRRGISADWLRIHRGLTMVLASILISIGLGLLLAVGLFAIMGSAFAGMGAAAAAGPGAAPGQAVGQVAALGAGIVILGILAIVGSLASLALRVTGHVFCLPSPNAFGSRSLAIATLALVLTSLGCTLLQWIITFATLGSRGLGAIANPMMMGAATNALSTVVSWIGGLAGLAAFFVFLFYLRSLALATRHDGLARNIIRYVISVVAGSVGLCVASCLGTVVMAAAVGAAAAQQRPGAAGMGNPGAALAGMGAMGLVCGGVWVLFALGMFVWYIVLIVQTRGAVATRLRRA
jgi:hypothetical protein